MRAALWAVNMAFLLPTGTQASRADDGIASKTRVVMLGTGTPQARPEAAGPAVAIVAGGAVYLVEWCGVRLRRQRKGLRSCECRI
jgi:hypothetical protein